MGTKDPLSPSHDEAAARRNVETNVDHLAYLFVPGDVLQFTHGGTATVGLKCRVVRMEEGQDKRIRLGAVEHSPTLDALRNSVASPPPGCLGRDCEPDEDDPGDTDPGTCEEARGGTGSLVAWFNGGGPYAPGTYFINYLGGAYKLTPSGGYAVEGYDVEGYNVEGYDVEGYDVVTRDADGAIVVLMPAPAVSNPTNGFASDGVAEDANDGESAAVALAALGPVGIRLRSGAAYTNDGPEGPVRYEFCLDEHTATCEDCPATCATGCTDAANAGLLNIASTKSARCFNRAGPTRNSVRFSQETSVFRRIRGMTPPRI